MKEIHGFIKNLFLSGQNDLQSRDHEASEKEEESAKTPHHINRFKLNVQCNAVCVDILVWATKDEYGEFQFICPQFTPRSYYYYMLCGTDAT